FISCDSAIHTRLLLSFPTRRSSDLYPVTPKLARIPHERCRFVRRAIDDRSATASRGARSRRRRWAAGYSHAPRANGDFRKRARRSEEHTSELQSPDHIVCRLLLEKK